MRKLFKIFLLFLAIFVVFCFFWLFSKRNFDLAESFPVKLSDNGLVFSVEAKSQTVSELLAEKNIALGGKDYIFPASDARIFPGSKITIRRAMNFGSSPP